VNKRHEFFEDAINKMMEIAGYSERIEDLREEEDGWYNKYTMTEEQEEEFKEWFTKEIVKRNISNKRKAEDNYLWFFMCYGLKVERDGRK